jgi:hypothetical protein
MKQSSINANNTAENSGLKESHRAKILKTLIDCELNATQIGILAKLDYHAVGRRMSELERDGKVFVVSELPTCIYKLTNKDYPNLNRAKYEEKQFRKWQKKAKQFDRFLELELINKIIGIR